tara:strand:+ start:671 stop:982 length:312 start_codon:yes stop_codon:yes gene_type:complete
MKFIFILFYFTINLWAIEIEKTFQVEGMMCKNACPKKIIESTYDIDGIKNCTVDFKSKTATIIFDDEKVNSKLITEIINQKTYFKISETNQSSWSIFDWIWGK